MDPEKVRRWVDDSRRRTRLASQSRKRRAEARARRDVVAEVVARDGGCVARDLVPEVECWGPLDVDEVVSRGVRPGGHLDAGNAQALCRGHHEWRGANPAEARERGIRKASFDS